MPLAVETLQNTTGVAGIRERIRVLTDPTTRWVYQTSFQKRPLLEADYDVAAFSQAANRLIMDADPDWRADGVNLVETDITYAAGGGIDLTTHGTVSGDQAILKPKTVNGGATGTAIGSLGHARLNLNRNPYMLVVFDMLQPVQPQGATYLQIGLRNVIDGAFTDTGFQDGACVCVDPAHATAPTRFRLVTRGLNQAIDNIIGPDPVVHAIAATRSYVLEIMGVVGSSGYSRATAWIDGIPIGTGLAMLHQNTFNTRWQPIIGVETKTTNFQHILVRKVILSRNHATAATP